MRTIFIKIALLTIFSAQSYAQRTVEFLPNNDLDDHIMYSSHIVADQPNPGITEMTMVLINGDFILAKQPLVRIETPASAFTSREGSIYQWAPVNFRVNLKEVRVSIQKILDEVGGNSRGGKFSFMLTHISTAPNTPNMPLLRPLLIDIEDFSSVYANKLTQKPFHSIFSLYDGGERQLDPSNPKRATILLGYQIQFFRTLLKGAFPSAVRALNSVQQREVATTLEN